jgi:dihydroorotate dehydrogenase
MGMCIARRVPGASDTLRSTHGGSRATLTPRAMTLYRLLRPFFFCLDPERAHHLTIRLLTRLGPTLRRVTRRPDTRLQRTVFGVRFPNPVGLAAGFDKNGVALPAWQALGFGFAEVGTITSRAQPGNPKPRIVRFPGQRAIVNRLGFNNEGADAVASRLRRMHQTSAWPHIPIGINIGKSRVTAIEEANADYLLSFERLHHFGDYFVLNVSSPNTPGLRSLQDHGALGDLIDTIQRRNTSGKPLLVKVAPDLPWSAVEEIVALAVEHQLAGIVATNTTTDHSSLPPGPTQQGGLSGDPLRQRSTEMIRFITERCPLPVIGVGGISTVDAALEKLDAGASLIQIYTGLVYEGPGLVHRIKRALLARQ